MSAFFAEQIRGLWSKVGQARVVVLFYLIGRLHIPLFSRNLALTDDLQQKCRFFSRSVAHPSELGIIKVRKFGANCNGWLSTVRTPFSDWKPCSRLCSHARPPYLVQHPLDALAVLMHRPLLC
jgi:hypothetical protein